MELCLGTVRAHTTVAERSEENPRQYILYIRIKSWYFMVAHNTLRIYVINSLFRFVEGILKLHSCAACPELPTYISTKDKYRGVCSTGSFP